MAQSDSTQKPHRVKDLTGQRFGHQVVIGFAEMRGKIPYWNVRCDCGDERPVSGYSLKAGRSTRCSRKCPANPPVKDERGKVYNRLTVIELAEIRGEARWLCRCECGNLTKVAGSDLRGGDTKSCGCLRASQGGGHGTTEYTTWKEMKRRCFNTRNSQYYLYGGRGITICDRWRKSFVNFLADMGPKPFPEASIDRYPDMNGPYSPENCRWATKMEQSQNSRKARMLTYNGETMCMRAWARRLGITHGTLRRRIKLGWSPEKVFSSEHYFTPPPIKRAKSRTATS